MTNMVHALSIPHTGMVEQISLYICTTRIRTAFLLRREKMGKVKAWMMDREDRASDRGAADRYYGRQPDPRIWLDNIGGEVVPKKEMSENEIEAYWEGWRNEEDRKDWG
jgi:hypothetical protein